MFNSTMLMSSFIPLVFPTNTKCLFDFHNMTRLDVSESDKHSLSCGVPQGSVLGPICISYIPHLLAIYCDVTTCHFTFMLMTPNYIQPSLTTMNLSATIQ